MIRRNDPTDFNRIIKNDEEQKQCVLQCVVENRKVVIKKRFTNLNFCVQMFKFKKKVYLLLAKNSNRNYVLPTSDHSYLLYSFL